jgi:hypothetical protein
MVVIIGVLLGVGRKFLFFSLLVLFCADGTCAVAAVIGLASATQPEVVHYLPWLGPVARKDNLQSAVATAIAPAIAGTCAVRLDVAGSHLQSSEVQCRCIGLSRKTRGVQGGILGLAGIWIVTAGSLIVGVKAFDDGNNASSSIASGSVTTAIFLLIILLNIAIIAPGLLLLQPIRLWKLWKAKKRARTPRQLFRGEYCSYDRW